MLALFLLAFSAISVTPAFTEYECGVVNGAPSGSARVVQGVAETYFKYPWFAAIHLPNEIWRQVCGGALISPQFVMTAAHCFSRAGQVVKKDRFDVTLGIYNRCTSTPSAVTYKISEIFVHPEYEYPMNLKNNDIALLKLDGSSELMPVCLPPKGAPIKHENSAVVAGFGRLNYWRQPCEINEAVVEIYTNEECRNQSTIDKDVLDNMVQLQNIFCAGKMAGGPDACQGDSGAALLVKKTKRDFAKGIVSFGFGCGRRDKPGIYTNVASYIDWINKTMDGELRMYQAPRKKMNPLGRRHFALE